MDTSVTVIAKLAAEALARMRPPPRGLPPVALESDVVAALMPAIVAEVLEDEENLKNGTALFSSSLPPRMSRQKAVDAAVALYISNAMGAIREWSAKQPARSVPVASTLTSISAADLRAEEPGAIQNVSERVAASMSAGYLAATREGSPLSRPPRPGAPWERAPGGRVAIASLPPLMPAD